MRKKGFSLIEVVVALVVAVLVWGAAASALATVARMDATAARFHSAGLFARTLAAYAARDEVPAERMAPEGWRFESVTGADSDGRTWHGWRMQTLGEVGGENRVFTDLSVGR